MTHFTPVHPDRDFYLCARHSCRREEEARPCIADTRHKLVEPRNGRVDFTLILGIVVTGAVAANRVSVLTKAADPSTQASAVQVKKPFQLPAVNGFFSSGMIFSEIVADFIFLIHSVSPFA